MLKDYLREPWNLTRAILRAVGAKAAVATRGESAVAPSCQIPDLRAKYTELSLPSRKGVFVEVGAYDGESFSNTSFLADQGWRGVYVEPIPRYFRRMQFRHIFNNVKGENVAIAETSGTAEITDMGSLTTMNKVTVEHYKGVSWASSIARDGKTSTISTETLQTVLARNAVPHNFDLMVVDIEGNEETIIKSLLTSPWRPRVLIVELCDVHPDFVTNAACADPAARVRASLISAGYREYFVDPINTIFAI